MPYTSEKNNKYHMKDRTLKVSHNSGFFSCCSVGLHYICEYINENSEIPDSFDRTDQFINYKRTPDQDLSQIIYRPYGNIETADEVIDFFWEKQFEPYHELDFKLLSPLVDNYYSPSEIILDRVSILEKEMGVPYSEIIAICYRGNDKHTETCIGSYEEYLEKANELLKQNPNFKFYVQTDVIEFLNYFLEKYPDSFYDKKIRTISHDVSSAVFKVIPNFTEEKYEFACNFLASVIFMSRCNGLITHSGNGGLWIALYRGHFTNSYQYLRGKWLPEISTIPQLLD